MSQVVLFSADYNFSWFSFHKATRVAVCSLVQRVDPLLVDCLEVEVEDGPALSLALDGDSLLPFSGTGIGKFG